MDSNIPIKAALLLLICASILMPLIMITFNVEESAIRAIYASQSSINLAVSKKQ